MHDLERTGERARIPNDEELAKMSPSQIAALADSLTTPEQREQLSDALLKVHKGWQVGAHSEVSDTRRNRRHAREQSMEELAEAAGVVIPTAPPSMLPLIQRALKASVDEEVAVMWILHEDGWTQARIAETFDVSQGCVSQRLARARDLIRDNIDEKEGWFRILCVEMRRRRYVPLQKQPPLASEIQAARIVLEANGLETWILRQDPGSVIIVDAKGNETRVTFRELLRQARDLQRN